MPLVTSAKAINLARHAAERQSESTSCIQWWANVSARLDRMRLIITKAV